MYILLGATTKLRTLMRCLVFVSSVLSEWYDLLLQMFISSFVVVSHCVIRETFSF